jgi:hypothetical protein
MVRDRETVIDRDELEDPFPRDAITSQSAVSCNGFSTWVRGL